MKFFAFNIAIIAALYYLFTNDVNHYRDIKNDARKGISRIETLASSAMSEVLEQTNQKEMVQSMPTPNTKSALPLVSPLISIATRAQPVSDNTRVRPELDNATVADSVNDEAGEEIPTKSPAEKRKDLLEMAQNMELLYLRKAGE